MVIRLPKFAHALMVTSLLFGCASPPSKHIDAHPDRSSQLPKQMDNQSAWVAAIRKKIRYQLVLPAGTPSGIKAVFAVVQLPSGEVLSASLKSSSGFPDYDNAAYRAILKASPLPKPDDPNEFVRTLVLTFTP